MVNTRVWLLQRAAPPGAVRGVARPCDLSACVYELLLTVRLNCLRVSKSEVGPCTGPSCCAAWCSPGHGAPRQSCEHVPVYYHTLV